MRRRLLLAAALIMCPIAYVSAMHLRATPVGAAAAPSPTRPLPDLGPMPELAGGTQWFNGPPLRRSDLAGKVVMVEVWTYTCGNCLNALPYIKATAARYKSAGLVTIGVHTPESEGEKVAANVARRVQALGVEFPVVMDNDFAIWRAFDNRYWPSVYVIDRKGRIRFHHDGEGRYADIDAAVRALLTETE